MVDAINNIALMWWDWMAAMFWQVSLLIILIACLDTIIKRWAWPRLRYALWLLVLLKLVLPPDISMPGSFTARMQPVTDRIVDSMTREQPAAFEESSAEIQYEHFTIVPAVISTPTRATVRTLPPIRAFGDYAVEASADEPAPSVRLLWQFYAMVIWIFGMTVLGFWLISRLYRLRKGRPQTGSACSIPQSFHNMMLRCAQQLKLRRIPRIVVTKKVVCPAVFGVFRPVLLMPKGYLSKLSRKDAEHMLLHELAHIKRGDPVVHGFYLILQIVYWFNPFLWLVRRQLIHLRELCCDATVAGLLKNRTCEYRETLIDVARRFLTRPVEPGIGLLGLFEDTNRLLVRLSWLEKKTWRYKKMKNVIVITIIALMIAFVLPMAVGREAPSDEDYFVGTDQSKKESPLSSEENVIKQDKEKEQLLREMQALKVQLEKLNAQKQNLQKELSSLEKSRMSADKSKEKALEVSKKAKAEKDKAQKYSAEAKKYKHWAEQWTNSEEFKQWQKDLEKWSKQIQKLHQNNNMHNWAVDPEYKEAFMEWHQEMQQWQNSDEFKNWQQQMKQWLSKKQDWQKQMPLNPDAHADEDSEPMEIPTIHPSPPMPPMPKMPPLPSMPPMPEDSTVSVDVVEPVLPHPNVEITPKSALSEVVVPMVKRIEVPVQVTVPVVATPGSRLTAQTGKPGINIQKDKDDEFEAKKEMDFTTKIQPGTPFVVRNKIGKIVLNPSKDRNCTVKAYIRATADTTEKAQELADQVSMNTHSSREKFYFEPVKSGDDKWNNLNVDLHITVPSGIAPDISTDVGSIEINNLKERIKGITNVGSIKVVNVTGDIQLTTKVGDIEFIAHKGLSAKIQASTKVGSINSELPLEIKKEDFVSSTAKGTIGSGEKDIRLITEVGKIFIRKQSKESSDNNLEKSVSVRTITQNNVITDRPAAAQLSSNVELSSGDSVRMVRSIEDSQQGNLNVIKRVEMMKIPISPGSVLEVSNEDGSITVVGSDTDDCQVDSTFTIKAPTAEAVKALSKEVSLNITPTSKGLSIKVDHPKNTLKNHSYQVDLQIIVPGNMNLILNNEDGNVQVRNLEGQIQIGVEDGDIVCENITADVRLVSEDGNIDIRKSKLAKLTVRKEDGNVKCDNIYGDCDILVEDGDVIISYAEDLTENCTCVVRGDDGNVTINRGSFAECRIKMESGKIECDKVRGNLDFKLEDGRVNVNYADNIPESCTINVQLEEGSVKLSAPGGMFPADGPSQAKKKDEGAEWKTQVSTSGGSRTVNLKTDEGSIKVEKR